MVDVPKRGDAHDALAVFLGKWTARGTSYGGADQQGQDPSRGSAHTKHHGIRGNSS